MYTWWGCESHDFAPVSQHFRGEKENIFLFFLKGRFRIVLKEAGDAQYSRKHGNIAQYSRKHRNIIDVRISSRCCWCWGNCDPSTYTFCTSRWWTSWNVSGISTKTDGVAFGICWRNLEQVEKVAGRVRGAGGPIFLFLSWRRSDGGAPEPHFFFWLSSSLSRSVLLTTNPMTRSPWQVLLVKDFNLCCFTHCTKVHDTCAHKRQNVPSRKGRKRKRHTPSTSRFRSLGLPVPRPTQCVRDA